MWKPGKPCTHYHLVMVFLVRFLFVCISGHASDTCTRVHIGERRSDSGVVVSLEDQNFSV